MNLNLIDYEISKHLVFLDLPITALIAAAISRADTANLEKLRKAFPDIAADNHGRRWSQHGDLPSDKVDHKSATALKAARHKAVQISAAYMRGDMA